MGANTVNGRHCLGITNDAALTAATRVGGPLLTATWTMFGLIFHPLLLISAVDSLNL
jgi:hypothetical protein